MKSLKKLLVLVLIIAMTVTMFACSGPSDSGNKDTVSPTSTPKNEDKDTSSTDNTDTEDVEEGRIVDGFYRYNDTVKIEVMSIYEPELIQNPDKLWIFEWAKDKMNIDFQVEHVSAAAMGERTTLMFASDDIPEALFTWYAINSKGSQSMYGDKEGQLIPINEFINEDIMPNLYRNTQEVPETISLSATLEGNVYTLPQFQQKEEYRINPTFQPLWYNTKWLSAIGYTEPPETLDEFVDVLRQIKEKDPGNAGDNLVPLGGSSAVYNPSTVLLNSFGFVTNSYSTLYAVRDGDYKTGEMVMLHYHDVYYEFLKFMNTLYNEGLIDRDFYSLDSSQVNAKAANGYYGFFAHYRTNGIVEDWSEWEMLDPMTCEWNDKKITSISPPVTTPGFVFITSKCKKPEAVLRFMDVAYDREKGYLFFNGPQQGVDDTYGLVSGWTFDESGVTKVYEDVTSGKIESNSAYHAHVGPFGFFGNLIDRRTDGAEVAKFDPKDPVGYTNLQVIEHWCPYSVVRHPGGMFDPDTSAKLTDYETVIKDYITSETAKFITGARPLTEEEFEKYRSDLDSMDMQEYFEIQLQAFKEQYK